MPRHCLLIVIIIAITLIYKEFFKNTKMSKILLKIGLVKFLVFSKVTKNEDEELLKTKMKN